MTIVAKRIAASLALGTVIAGIGSCTQPPELKAFEAVRLYVKSEGSALDRARFMEIVDEDESSWLVHTSANDFAKLPPEYRGFGYYFTVSKKTLSVVGYQPVL